MRDRRLMAAAALIVHLVMPLSAQTISLTPIGGAIRPLSGEMWMNVPNSFTPDSSRIQHRFGDGVTLGALIEIDRAGPLNFAARLTANYAERWYKYQQDPEPFGSESSTIYAAAFFATTSLPLTERLRLHVSGGPELVWMTGEAAYNDEVSLPPRTIAVPPGATVGGSVDLAASYALADGNALRFGVGYRYFAPKHRYARPDSPPAPGFGDEPFEDLLITMGVTIRLR